MSQDYYCILITMHAHVVPTLIELLASTMFILITFQIPFSSNICGIFKKFRKLIHLASTPARQHTSHVIARRKETYRNRLSNQQAIGSSFSFASLNIILFDNCSPP